MYVIEQNGVDVAQSDQVSYVKAQKNGKNVLSDRRDFDFYVMNGTRYEKDRVRLLWKDGSVPAFPELRALKETAISAACNAAIVAGMDVETSRGTEHFSLQETDQINLTTALSAVQGGAAGYPYHADGALCRMFTAEEITTISSASIAHKLYHTTLCNHLLTWVRRTETEDELAGITYAAEGLPEDLAANMAQVLAAAQNV